MAYRLLVRIGDRALRFPLNEGGNTVGSSPDCGLVIRHPSVSRRHAELVVTEDGVTIADLGSSNGTRLSGRTVTEPVTLEPGAELRLGSVAAELEVVRADDLETGVAMPTFDREPSPAKPSHETPASTMGPAVLEVFALRQLPELVNQVARGESHTQLAQAVGAALLGSLPCSKIEVAGPEAVLFCGERGGDDSATPVAADAGDGFVLNVGFVSDRLAQAYGPLVDASAALIRAAGPRVLTHPGRISEPDPIRPPQPPSIEPRMQEVYGQAARIARGRVSVLIRGESGTGKELLARYLHAASERAEAPLVTLNCAALPRDLLESELFGVERGVATGVEARAGKFEAAHGGTLFLDEIGDMAPETQARILRVLQEGEVYRIGGHAPRPADARVISATNRDLPSMLDDGRFRRDLYHRIADWVVELPPLRQRRRDIPNLAAHFLARSCVERGVHTAGISRAAVEALVAYGWPGNVRQLEKEMARASLFLEDGEMLDTSRLQEAITKAGGTAGTKTLKEIRERAEREHIEKVLAECDGVIADAAEILDIGLSTLYGRLKDLEIG